MDNDIVAGMKRGLHRMNESSVFSEALREPVLLAILYITELEQEVERLRDERRLESEALDRLRQEAVDRGDECHCHTFSSAPCPYSLYVNGIYLADLHDTQVAARREG